MSYYAIDTETFYNDECSVKTLGPEAYVRHPQFKCYMVAIHGPDLTYVGDPLTAPWNELADADGFVAHNARFDRAVFLSFIDKAVPGFTNGLKLVPWFCTADLAVYLRAGRSLKDAAKDLLGVTLNKDLRDKARGKSWEQMVAEGMSDKMLEYCSRDAELCYTLWDKFSDKWPDTERAISALNMDAGASGIRIDEELLDKGMDILSDIKFKAGKLIPWDWGDNKTPLSPIKLGLACRAAGIEPPSSVAEDSEECAEWEEQYAGKYPWISTLRDWRKANILWKKLQTVRNRLSPDGILNYEIKYFGAHTGRFSGSGGFNIQNMPREPLNGVHLRNMIIPRTGKKIVHIDLSQIEARILLWFVKDEEALARIRNGEHIYEVHARETMGWTGGPLKKENPKLYSLAKARVLGAGYQCGGPRFVSLAKTMAGVILTEDEAVKTIADYRAKNKLIVAFWGRLNRDFFWSYQKGEPYEMCLPSGRVLRYENIKSIGGSLRASVEINGNPHNFFGGKLTENLVQATARDVFAAAMMRASENFPVLFHVHDESNFEVDATTAEYDATEIKRLFEEPVPWLPGCPIEAEVKVLDRYEK